MYKAVSSEAALFQSDPFITFIFSTGGIILKPYIIKRILSAIPLLLIISFVCFVFINLIPSDPAEVALRVRQVPIITEDAIAEVRSQLGLDKPYPLYLGIVLCFVDQISSFFRQPANLSVWCQVKGLHAWRPLILMLWIRFMSRLTILLWRLH